MIRIYRHNVTATPASIDGNGHVNNVVYVQWMQDAALAHSGAVGCTQATFESGATWVARSHKIEYLRPAFEGDEIAVLTWVTDFRKVRSLRKYRFFRKSDGALVAAGETDWVYVDARSGRPLAIPTHISSLFELVPQDEEPRELA